LLRPWGEGRIEKKNLVTEVESPTSLRGRWGKDRKQKEKSGTIVFDIARREKGIKNPSHVELQESEFILGVGEKSET